MLTFSQGKTLYLIESDVECRNITLLNNYADNSLRNFYMVLSTLRIEHSELTDDGLLHNSSLNMVATGHFLYSIDSHIEIENSTISGGSTQQGGALFLLHSSLDVQNSLFRNNTASQSGGAIYAQSSPKIDVINSTFIDNFAVTGDALNIDLATGDIQLSQCRFEMSQTLFGYKVQALLLSNFKSSSLPCIKRIQLC